jgi:hypothetical protein
MVSSGMLMPCDSFLQEPHGVTSQKTPFFIVTAVKTSNLTKRRCFYSLLRLPTIKTVFSTLCLDYPPKRRCFPHSTSITHQKTVFSTLYLDYPPKRRCFPHSASITHQKTVFSTLYLDYPLNRRHFPRCTCRDITIMKSAEFVVSLRTAA